MMIKRTCSDPWGDKSGPPHWAHVICGRICCCVPWKGAMRSFPLVNRSRPTLLSDTSSIRRWAAFFFGNVADPGCLSRIKDSDFFPSRIQQIREKFHKIENYFISGSNSYRIRFLGKWQRILTIYLFMILMAPCIIDFIGANALLGPVKGREPWTLLGP